MTKLCECGCGQTVNRRFVRGHSQRGVILTAEHRARIGAANALVAHPSGSDHPRYVQRDSDLSYSGVHIWVRANKERTGTCEECGQKPKPGSDGRAGTDFANISGEYRRDIDDYVELCRSCHWYFDNGRELTSSGQTN